MSQYVQIWRGRSFEGLDNPLKWARPAPYHFDMTAVWESRVLGPVVSDPRELARDVAEDLGLLSSSVIEVVRLHLEALDCSLTMDAPELLADQLGA